MESLFFEGLFLQASLIFSLGAQNLFVLESGIKKQHPFFISFTCFICDLALIMIGVIGAGSFISNYSQLKILVGLVGVLFLIYYGFSKIFSNINHSKNEDQQSTQSSIKNCILLSITFSILNPHAYLDAFILIGGYASKYDQVNDRILLGLGAAVYSLIWFLMLSHAPSIMKPIFSCNKKLKYISVCSGILLLLLSIRLGMDIYSWIVDGPHRPLAVHTIKYPLPSGLLYSSILF